jgi:hypothetical protein
MWMLQIATMGAVIGDSVFGHNRTQSTKEVVHQEVSSLNNNCKRYLYFGKADGRSLSAGGQPKKVV